MALRGAYAPASITIQVTGARKLLLQEKTVALETVSYSSLSNIKLRVNIPVSFQNKFNLCQVRPRLEPVTSRISTI
jgi:hypothetical protein